jgi:hypothetical protein
MFPVAEKVFVAGSNISAVCSAEEPSVPPAMSTFPFGSRVAVCPFLDVSMLAVGVNPDDTTVTIASPLTVGSETSVATTWNVPVVVGAVYIPSFMMLPLAAPSKMLHVTLVLTTVPLTVATKVRKPFGPNVSDVGLTDTETAGTLIVETPLFVRSAWLVATR